MVCLRRFSTEAPAARRKRPWGTRGDGQGGHGGVGRGGSPGWEALARSGWAPGPHRARVNATLGGSAGAAGCTAALTLKA